MSQVACRCQEPLTQSTISKIAMFCQVEPSQVIAVHDVSSTYHVPMLLERQGLIENLTTILRLDACSIPPSLLASGQSIWHQWRTLTTSQERFLETEKVTIALVGKYTNLHDSYLSVIKSLEHSAMACARKLDLRWVDASHLEKQTANSSPEHYHKAWHELCTADGVLVPGGFGHRGTEGMVAAANWARTKPKPYLGICLGMQLAVVEYARNVCNIPNATSVELDAETSEPVVIFMPEIDKKTMGGNMRLGLRPTLFQQDSEWSRLRKLYNNVGRVNERHRHRYEVNPDYIERLSVKGLDFIGKDDKGVRMEIVELRDHPWFVGVQFHPEYLSRVLKPSPPYLGFVAASCGLLDQVTNRFLSGKGLVNGVNGEVHVNGELANGVKNVSL
jgi:CTP synthase